MANISHSSLLQIKEEKARKNLADALGYFRLDWNNLASLISRYYPLEVLKMAVWEERRVSQVKKNDKAARAAMRFFPHLLQSVVQSKAFSNERGFSANRDIKQKDWNRIKELGYDAAKRLSWYLENFAVVTVHEGKVSKEHYEAFREKLLSQFFFHELTSEEEEYCALMFSSFFYDDEESAKKYFHTDSSTLVEALRTLYDIGISGIDYLSGESFEIQLEIKSRISEEREKGSTLTDEELTKKISAEDKIKYRIERFKRRRDGYDLFSVEANTLLSTEACLPLSLNIASYDSSDFTTDGFLTSVYYPFLRFADRFFTFTGKTLGETFPIALKKIIHNGCESFKTTDKIQAATDHLLDQFMSGTDIPDVWQWKGHKIDVLVMTQTYFLNAYRHPNVFEERCRLRDEERATKPRTGHLLLLVDPDSFAPVTKINDTTFSLSIPYLAKLGRSEKYIEEFYETLFCEPYVNQKSSESSSLEEAFDDDVLPEEEEEREEELPTLADDEFSVVDEGEYDSSDDDEKARSLEEKYDSLSDEPPLDSEAHTYSKEELSQLQSKYELPEEYLNDDPLDSFYLDEDEESDSSEKDDLPFDDEEDDDLWDEDEYKKEEEEEEAFCDEDKDEESADLYEDESDLLKEDGAYEDPDQLLLFDSDVVEASEEEEADDEVDTPPIKERGESSEEEDDEIPLETAAETAEEEDLTPEESEETAEAEEAEEEIAEEELSEDTTATKESKERLEDDEIPLKTAAETEDTTIENSAEEVNEEIPSFSLKSEGELEEEPKEKVEEKESSYTQYPPLVSSILSSLDKTEGKAFFDFVEGVESSVLEEFSQAIKDCIDKVKIDGKDKLLSIFDFNLSIIVASDKRVDSLRLTELRNNVGAVTYSRSASAWTSIVLFFTEGGTLEESRSEILSEKSFTQSNWKIVRVLGEQLIEKRKGINA